MWVFGVLVSVCGLFKCVFGILSLWCSHLGSVGVYRLVERSRGKDILNIAVYLCDSMHNRNRKSLLIGIVGVTVCGST